jgi:phosphate transport system substrate-binding protein
VRRISGILVFISLILSVTVSAQELPPVTPEQVQGDMLVSGVEILEPLTTTLINRFGLDGYTGEIILNETSTAEAFTALCNGNTDIALTGRQINSEEENLCQSQGRAPVPFRVATSAVVLVVSPQNTLINDVNINEIQQLYGSGTAWSQVRPNWPDEPINRYGPPVESEVFQLFVAAAFGGNDRNLRTAFNATYSPDLNTLAQNVSNDRLAVGFFGLSFLNQTDVSLRRLSISGIAPDQNSVVNGNYALSRPLFLYSTDVTMRDKPQVTSFLNYYLRNLRQEIGAQPFFPPSSQAYNVALNNWFQFSGQAQDSQTIPADPTPAGETEDIEQIPAQPTATPAPTFSFQDGVLPLLAGARRDLEVLADDVFDGTTRPAGWDGTLSTDNPRLPVVIRLDLETLAAVYYGPNTRPDNWRGAVSSTQLAIARDIRHDLEIMALDYYGGLANYPEGWADFNPILRCARSTVNLVEVAQEAGFELQISPQTPNYCREAELAASRYAEINMLAPGSDVEIGRRSDDQVQIGSDVVIDTRFAVAFFDRNGRQKVGVIPEGTFVQPVARSYVQFSNMMLVQGADFLVYVDWLDTSLTSEQFRSLPDVNTIEAQLYCDALWCNTRP